MDTLYCPSKVTILVTTAIVKITNLFLLQHHLCSVHVKPELCGHTVCILVWLAPGNIVFQHGMVVSAINDVTSSTRMSFRPLSSGML